MNYKIIYKKSSTYKKLLENYKKIAFSTYKWKGYEAEGWAINQIKLQGYIIK